MVHNDPLDEVTRTSNTHSTYFQKDTMEEPMNLTQRRLTRQKTAQAIAEASPPLNLRLRNTRVKGKGEKK